MATPRIFGIRLHDGPRKNLEELSKVYGARSPSGFAAELITAMCSGNQEQLSAFVGKLMKTMQEQMTLDFMARIDRETAKGVPKAKAIRDTKAGLARALRGKRRRPKGGRRAKPA